MARSRIKQIDGTLPEPSAMTVGKYLTHWLATIKPTVAKSTHLKYEQDVDKHLRGSFAEIKLQKLETYHVEQVLSKIVWLSARRAVTSIVKEVLRHAIPSVIQRNPADPIQYPKPTKPEFQVLTADQVKMLLKAIDGGRFENVLVLLIETGARVSEVLALQEADIDLKAGKVSVRRTLQGPAQKAWPATPKTKASIRSIDIGPRAVKAIVAQRARKMKAGAAGQPWLFCTATGAFLCRDAILWELRKILKDAGLPRLRTHDLRHTHATLLLQAGVPVKVVSERLGHGSTAITNDTYAHVLPTMQADAVKRLDRLLG